MYYNHTLRVNIQEWKNRFFKSEFENANNNFRFLFDRLHKDLVIVSLFDELAKKFAFSEEDILEILEMNIEDHDFSEEDERNAFHYQFCKWLITEKKDFRYFYAFGNGDEGVSYFKDNIIEPLINYVHDKLDEVSNVLYILEKYKLRTEWFTKSELVQKYNDATRSYEQILEDNLRLYLYDHGVDYPFSTPKSASGRADIVSLLDTEDPLVLEIKIYDSSKGYKKDRIISGFTQIVKYANDYHKDTGYLVVFNMDNIEIEIENKEQDKTWPNRLIFNGKTYYVIIINMNNEVSASKLGKLKTESISFAELTTCI